MNLQQLKYAIEIEKDGSISKAAENLYMRQPHLSRAIRELEASMGIDIFRRTSKGVEPTEIGRDFLQKAKDIVCRVESFENMYRASENSIVNLRVCVPDFNYISLVLTKFAGKISEKKSINIECRASDIKEAVKDVSDGAADFAVIRYLPEGQNSIIRLADEKRLNLINICENKLMITVSADSELRAVSAVNREDIEGYRRISDTIFSPDYTSQTEQKYISIKDRESQLLFLSSVPHTYMITSKLSNDIKSHSPSK